MIKILVVDTTFFGCSVNREKTTEHIAYWSSFSDVQLDILTSPQGIAYYMSAIRDELVTNIKFISIPFSTNQLKVSSAKVIIEFILRSFGVVVIKKKKWNVIYSISAIWTDVFATKIMSLKCPMAKTFVTFDNFVPQPQKRPGNLYTNTIAYWAHLSVLKMLRSMDMIFAYLTETNYQRLISLGFSREQLSRFENALSLDYINSVEVNQKKYDIAYLGRIHESKGIFDFVKVIDRLKEQNKNIKTIVIGNGSELTLKKVSQKIYEHKLENNIVLKGFVDQPEKYKLLKASKVFLFLSYDESFPVSVLEAICCNLPVVAYDLDVYNSEPFKHFNIHINKKNDIKGVCEKIKLLFQEKSTYPIKNKLNLIPNYKSNSFRELECFRKSIID